MSDKSWIHLKNETVWPSPSGRVSDVSWRMIHAPETVSKGDMLFATSIMSAYSNLMLHPAFTLKEVQKIVSGIRKAVSEEAKEQP